MSNTTTLTTIEQFFDYAKSCFLLFEDSYDAKVDAQALLCAVLDKPTSFLLTWPEKQLTKPQASLLHSFIERRKTGEPVAYIIGKREFWSLELFVAPCTLIPRPDTETLVEAVLDNHQQDNLTLLDLGTGTGAIALALANENASWDVDAIDFNQEAVSLAKSNAEHLQINNVSIYQSDWFSAISTDKRFDVIVSNPPYIDPRDELLEQGDVRFEPNSALIATDNGLADIKHIIKSSKEFLRAGGALYLEHGFKQHQDVQQVLAQNGYTKITTYSDFGGNPRITVGIL